MFSGIVETMGVIVAMHMEQGCKHFSISPDTIFQQLAIGESIAVNGVCLTVTNFTDNTFDVTVVPETLRLTNLALLVVGSPVNLERAMQANSRIGGHYVQGHVDGMGEILEIKHDDSDALLVKIAIPSTLSRYVINKGYIALDGMSITVIDVANDWFTVTFIPHTQEATTVKNYIVSSKINIEVDMIAKYIEKLSGVQTHAIRN